MSKGITDNNKKPMGEILLANPAVQEVVEHCLAYFAERLFGGGYNEWAEIEMLVDDTGYSEEELIEMFKELGYDETDGLEV